MNLLARAHIRRPWDWYIWERTKKKNIYKKLFFIWTYVGTYTIIGYWSLLLCVNFFFYSLNSYTHSFSNNGCNYKMKKISIGFLNRNKTRSEKMAIKVLKSFFFSSFLWIGLSIFFLLFGRYSPKLL